MNCFPITKVALAALLLPLAAKVVCEQSALAADARPLTVTFLRAETAPAAPCPRTVERILRHSTIRMARGRLVDVTRWRPDGEGADVLAALDIAPELLEVAVQLRGRKGRPRQRRCQLTYAGGEPAPDVKARRAAADIVGWLMPAHKTTASAAPIQDELQGELLPEAALAAFERALALGDARTPETLMERRSHLSTAVKLAPNWALAHLELGKTISAQGDQTSAIKSLMKAGELDPGDAETLAELGVAWRRMGRLPEAISSYSRALALAPHDPLVHNNFGVALWAAGQPEGASRHFKEASGIEPLYPDPLVNMGTHFRLVGREKEAEKYYRRAVRLAPDDPGPRIALAKLLTDAGDHRGTQEQLEAAVAANPDHPAARFQLALVLATRQKYSAAIKNLKRVLTLAPDYREARYNLGLCYHYIGRHDQAIEIFEQAIQRWPEYAWLYYGLGLTYEAKKENRLAEEALLMALEKDSALDPARAALKRIRGEDRAKPQLAWPWGLWCGSARSTAPEVPQTSAECAPCIITLAALLLPALALRCCRRKKTRQ